MYWTDVAGRTISRASLELGAEPETIVNSGQQLHSAESAFHLILQSLVYYMLKSPVDFSLLGEVKF